MKHYLLDTPVYVSVAQAIDGRTKEILEESVELEYLTEVEVNEVPYHHWLIKLYSLWRQFLHSTLRFRGE